MTGPADNTKPCPKCGVALHVRGCTLEMCADESGQSEAMRAAAGPPAPVEHPPPWWWEEVSNGALFLRDANGKALLMAVNNTSPFMPRVRALTEAAPELEDRLRHLLAYVEQLQRVLDPVFFPGGLAAELAPSRELLARIEERSKGGDRG